MIPIKSLYMLSALWIFSCAQLAAGQSLPIDPTVASTLILSTNKCADDNKFNGAVAELLSLPKDTLGLNTFIGLCYANHHDYINAEKYYEKAAKTDPSSASSNYIQLSQMYTGGRLPTNYVRAVRYAFTAIAASKTPSQKSAADNNLKSIIEIKGVVDEIKAKMEKNDPEALFVGGLVLISSNPSVGLGLIEKSAGLGYIDAQDNLASLYLKGVIVPQDYAQAASWFRKAADEGDAAAQDGLGLLYNGGLGVPQDHVQAASWYRKAAEQGYADAQYNLGVMYKYGQGVPQDYAQAVSWYRKAAEQGDADAQFNLGNMYNNGQGVPQDYAQAVSWYRKAAEQGNADAQNNLGNRYDNGQGVPQDAVIAYALYNLSAAKDPSKDNPATSNRPSLASKMTEAQIEQAQQLTQRMQTIGVLKAIDFMPKRRPTSLSHRPDASQNTNSPWPARPAKVPGQTTCNTRCLNGSCWRTYDNGRHVHFNVAPSIDPFSGNMTFNPPSC